MTGRLHSFWAGLGAVAVLLSGCSRKAETEISAPEGVTQSELVSVEAWVKWRLDTTVKAYETAGRRNAKWDAAAVEGLTIWAEAVEGRQPLSAFRSPCDALQKAIAAGCNDPLVRYFHAQQGCGGSFDEPGAYGALLREVAEELNNGAYPDVRKFYSAFRAAQTLWESERQTHRRVRAINPNTQVDRRPSPETQELIRRSIHYGLAVISDMASPFDQDVDIADKVSSFLGSWKEIRHDFAMRAQAIIDKKWAGKAYPHLFAGREHRHHAWDARGNGYANTVTEEGWELFRERLKLAQAELEKAWAIKQHEVVAYEMMGVELGQGHGSERLNAWFRQAMKLKPDYYEAANFKLYYLEPKWHGSEDEMIEFGRECVASDEWKGKVPLILWDAHIRIEKISEEKDYWKKPGVWEDVRASFEKFFKINPEERGWRHDYALYAYKCGQHRAFLEQVELMGPINHRYFGGEAAFSKMVAEARSSIGAP